MVRQFICHHDLFFCSYTSFTLYYYYLSGKNTAVEEADQSQPSVTSSPSSHSLMSLDKLELSTIVEEDSLMMNKKLCETSEEPEVVEPCIVPTAGTSFVDTNDPPPPLPLVSQTQSDEEDYPPSDDEDSPRHQIVSD